MRKILLLVLLLINISGCQRSEKWTDTVVLASGKTLAVERRVKLKLSGGELSHAFNMTPRAYEITVKPDEKSSFTWRGEDHVAPIFIDLKENKLYLVALITRCGASVKKLSIPRFPYLFFVGAADGKWSIVQPNQFPVEFKAVNLSWRYDESWTKYEGMKPGGTRSQKEIELRNKSEAYMTAGHFQIDFPRSFDEWTYKHKDQTDPQSRACEPRQDPMEE